MFHRLPPRHIGANFAHHRERRHRVNPIDPREIHAGHAVHLGLRIKVQGIARALARLRGCGWRIGGHRGTGGEVLLQLLITRRNLGLIDLLHGNRLLQGEQVLAW